MLFEAPVPPRSAARRVIDAHTRADEAVTVRALLTEATPDADTRAWIDDRARRLAEAVRRSGRERGGVQAMLTAYGLSTPEGVRLMRLAEALLRVPDAATRDALIRDKIGDADWAGRLRQGGPPVVWAATLGLLVAARLVTAAGSDRAAVRMVGRVAAPVVRAGFDLAMRVLARQFVLGRTIEDALARARPLEARGYRVSYDMLGEAARTMADADRYLAAYRGAIAAIGARGAGPGGRRGAIAGPGISVKLSALHPRFELAQAGRLERELTPRLVQLARAAAAFDLGLTIDAEEADRLEPTLEMVEALAADPETAGWHGLGVVVQAYQKRAPQVIDALAELATRHHRRLLVRLVKGAYWDSEIKRAQELGLPDYPVFTRKPATDVCFAACVRRLFARRDLFYPQVATHNARSVADTLAVAGADRDFEFQRLHGMGEALYAELVEHERLGVGCRIYAPVGDHVDLLAYLVRRLLENGANASFVHQLHDHRVAIDEIVADPVTRLAAVPSLPHPQIPPPRALLAPDRESGTVVDLANPSALATLAEAMAAAEATPWSATAIVDGRSEPGEARPATAPADRRRVIGTVADATPAAVERALASAARAASEWARRPVAERAGCLTRAADRLEAEAPALLALCVREAGKTVPDAVAELREAADFCRYYAARATEAPAVAAAVTGPSGAVVACISPWNFPVAIFTGQIAAALVAGHAVVAKPAEQTPLAAAAVVRLLHAAGVPPETLHLLPGDGPTVGGALVADPRTAAVCFTGSLDAAHAINRRLALRAGPPPLIAETGGQNAMVADTTALPEQVTHDVITSAFGSAGQRCSALRVLFVPEETAGRLIDMIAGAMSMLTVGDPALLSTDLGPVIDRAARERLEHHIAEVVATGRLIHRAPLGPACAHGDFVAPTLIEIDDLSRLAREAFGPVLHVIRYQAGAHDRVVAAVNTDGYGLTLGVQSRIDATWRSVAEAAAVGNVYVNRNQVGALVGIQPFGGRGLSGTGPKAGGPLYLRRLVAHAPGAGDAPAATPSTAPALPALGLSRTGLGHALTAARALADPWCRRPAADRAAIVAGAADRLAAVDPRGAALARAAAVALPPLTDARALRGPTGELNRYQVVGRGVIACVCLAPPIPTMLVAAPLLVGNAVVVVAEPDGALSVAEAFAAAGLPFGLLSVVPAGADATLADLAAAPAIDAVAFAGPDDGARALAERLAARPGPICPLIRYVTAPVPDALGAPPDSHPDFLLRFVDERTVTIDTAAAGGNAALLSLAS